MVFSLDRRVLNQTSSSNCPLNLICTSDAAKNRSWEFRCSSKEIQLSPDRPSLLRQECLLESAGSPPSCPCTGRSSRPWVTAPAHVSRFLSFRFAVPGPGVTETTVKG